MDTIYIISANGGLEEPSYASFIHFDEAKRRYDLWVRELLNEPGDRVDFLAVNTTTDTPRVKSVESQLYGE